MENQEKIFYISEASEEDEPPSWGQPHGENIVRLIHNPIALKKNNHSLHIISPNSLEFLHKHYPTVTQEQWNDWHWQVKNSIVSLEQLQKIINLSDDEIQPTSHMAHSLPIRITPYYASLMAQGSSQQAIRRCVVPTSNELILSEGESSDPLSEEHDSPVPNIVHRYPDRVLFLVTGFCSTYCRYCTRSHVVAKDKCHTSTKAWEQGLEYIRTHSEIRDVLISGGDVLTMSDSRIEYLLSRLRQIPHVEIIRMGTKVPIVLPQRITKSLLRILKRYHPLWMSLHFTHPDEITPEVTQACTQLADAGIPLGSQTVLLKGINDNVVTMKKLVQALLRIRVRPYYLYQCDPILGSAHFRTPVEKGLEIIQGLRGFTSGYAIPHYVIDAPHGGGKIPLLPEYYVGREGNQVILKNYEGKLFTYPDNIS